MDRSPSYLIDKISPEHFIFQHTFMYVIKGIVSCYDGSETHTFRSGECGIARKNRFARYKKEKEDDEIDKVFVFFDDVFLRTFQERYKPSIAKFKLTDTLIRLQSTELIDNFISSFKPYYDGGGRIKAPFADVKREELLLILLNNNANIASLFFDFDRLEKINIEEFMNRNYRFNVSIERFAYLTGRSLSSFKRDFHEIFGDTPSKWLIKKRLEEAYFLLDKKGARPSEIHFDLGFETFSHFSSAFKKKFGISPTDLLKERQ